MRFEPGRNRIAQLLSSDGVVARLLRFAVVGGFTSGLYVLIITVLVEFVGLNPILAAALAYVALLPVNFLGHKHATFRSRRSVGPEVMRFLGTHGITVAVSMLVMKTALDELDLPHWTGSLAIAVLAPVINFLLLHLWVFGSLRPTHRR